MFVLEIKLKYYPEKLCDIIDLVINDKILKKWRKT